MFVLDSDHIIIAQQSAGAAAENLRDRMAAHREEEFFMTVV